MGVASRLRFQGSQAGRRVLLVDGDPTSRASLCAGLRADGHQVVEVVGPTQLLFALQVAADALGPSPQVVIADLAMSGVHDVLLAHQEALAGGYLIALAPSQLPKELDALDPLAVFLRPFDDGDLRTIVMNAALLHRARAARRPALTRSR